MKTQNFPKLPDGQPYKHKHAVERLHKFLNSQAVAQFGPRNDRVTLALPRFILDESVDFAEVAFTDGGKSAFANLNRRAALWWENTIYQLAHELVHLLDPRPAPPHGLGATWFEEAVATSFARKWLFKYGRKTWEPDEHYGYAYWSLTQCGPDHLTKAACLRREFGHFSDVPKADIMHTFNCCEVVADQLARRFSDRQRLLGAEYDSL